MHHSLTIPPPLPVNPTIGWVSPSAGLAPFAMQRMERARGFFERQGWQVQIGAHALQNAGYVSASIADRVEDFHMLFQNQDVRVIMATIGGNHSNQLLSELNFDLIRRYPKMFVGYSDNTVLHFAFQSQANLSTYYGPCVMTQFGEYPKILQYTWDHFCWALLEHGTRSKEILPSTTWTDEVLDWFKNEDSKRPRMLQPNPGYVWLAPGRAVGPAWGGAIPSINHLAGTNYWVDPTDCIFFLDIPEGHTLGTGLPPAEVDAALADLKNLGIWDLISGLIIGRAPNYQDEETRQLKEMILRYAGDKKYPILFGANIGHADPIVTIRYGAKIELDSDRNLFRLER